VDDLGKKRKRNFGGEEVEILKEGEKEDTGEKTLQWKEGRVFGRIGGKKKERPSISPIRFKRERKMGGALDRSKKTEKGG